VKNNLQSLALDLLSDKASLQSMAEDFKAGNSPEVLRPLIEAILSQTE